MRGSIIGVLLFAIVCAGCQTASAGREFNAAAATTFIIGETTSDHARTVLGEPSTIETAADGTQIWTYSHTEMRVNALQMNLAAFGIGEMTAPTSESTLKLTFRNGVLADMASTISNS